MTTLIRGGLIHDAVHREAYIADILLAGGKIAGIGTDLTAPADAEIFDADGLDVYPGFVDAHILGSGIIPLVPSRQTSNIY